MFDQFCTHSKKLTSVAHRTYKIMIDELLKNHLKPLEITSTILIINHTKLAAIPISNHLNQQLYIN